VSAQVIQEVIQLVANGPDIDSNLVALLTSKLIKIVEALKQSVDVVRQDFAAASLRRNSIQNRAHRGYVYLRCTDANAH